MRVLGISHLVRTNHPWPLVWLVMTRHANWLCLQDLRQDFPLAECRSVHLQAAKVVFWLDDALGVETLVHFGCALVQVRALRIGQQPAKLAEARPTKFWRAKKAAKKLTQALAAKPRAHTTDIVSAHTRQTPSRVAAVQTPERPVMAETTYSKLVARPPQVTQPAPNPTVWSEQKTSRSRPWPSEELVEEAPILAGQKWG